MDLGLIELLAPKGLTSFVELVQPELPDMVKKVVERKVQKVRTRREISDFLYEVQRHNAERSSAHHAPALFPLAEYFKDEEDGLTVNDAAGLLNAVGVIMRDEKSPFVGSMTLDIISASKDWSYTSVTDLEEVFWTIEF